MRNMKNILRQLIHENELRCVCSIIIILYTLIKVTLLYKKQSLQIVILFLSYKHKHYV